jgi:hypothetical protein
MTVKIVTADNLNTDDFDMSKTKIEVKHKDAWGSTEEDQTNPISRTGKVGVSRVAGYVPSNFIEASGGNLATNNFVKIHAWGSSDDGTTASSIWGVGDSNLWTMGKRAVYNNFANNPTLSVGTSSRVSNLEVTGGLRVQNTNRKEPDAIKTLGHISTVNAAYNMYAGGFVTDSDTRFRTDSSSFTSTKKLIELDTVRYVLRDPASGDNKGIRYGLNIEQVEEHFPESVILHKDVDVTHNSAFLAANPVDGTTVREVTRKRFTKDGTEEEYKVILTDVKGIDYGSLVPHIIAYLKASRLRIKERKPLPRDS